MVITCDTNNKIVGMEFMDMEFCEIILQNTLMMNIVVFRYICFSP